MKRTPLERKTPLRAKPRDPRKPLRRSYMRRSPPRRIAKRAKDRPFVDWIHNGAPCKYKYVVISGRVHVCSGPVEGSHMGRKPGVGLKAPDWTMVRMCRGLHGQWTEARGVFAGWSKAQRREFADKAIDETTVEWNLFQGATP